MYGANRLAMGILLVWIAGFLFFIAFHPGGIKIYDRQYDTKTGKDVYGKDDSYYEKNHIGGYRTAKNPAEVLAYLMNHVATGEGNG